MINQNLHAKPVALDVNQHRSLKLGVPVTDWQLADKLNAMFVATVEFGDVCREFPIVFVRAGKDDDGSEAVAPIAVLGLAQQQNLYVSGGRWRAQYMPAVLRSYPFCIGRVDEERFAICVDMAFPGVGAADGEPLFETDGKPAKLLQEMTAQMEALEGEIQRTRLVGQRLLELDVLVEMRFDATLPDGRKHSVDGFMAVDQQKMTDLPADVVYDLHRTGVLAAVHQHWVSLGNMRRLLEWHAERDAVEHPSAALATSDPPSLSSNTQH
ncbi:MAG: SapC family protein [Pseudomonadota bacterium]|nr:SapC family protein [Pseudomonadota bacterium]